MFVLPDIMLSQCCCWTPFNSSGVLLR